jgi:hypothetical protein
MSECCLGSVDKFEPVSDGGDVGHAEEAFGELVITGGDQRITGLAIRCFLDDGTAEIDNNIAERTIRCIAIGCKNRLFARSKAVGERAAAIYCVIETAKLNSIKPQAYIADVIERSPAIGQRRAGTSLCLGTGQPVARRLA